MHSPTKETLRQHYLHQRQLLLEEEYERACSDICRRFFNYVDLTSIGVLHSFLSISSKREPDTMRILKKVMKTIDSVRIAVPRIETKHDIFESIYYQGQPLHKTKWGIVEPKEGERVCPGEIDLVLVPLLAFDTKGYRVGYGKGYYDRFLSTCKPDCRKLGLSLFPPERCIPVDRWDMRLNSCITPEQIYRFA